MPPLGNVKGTCAYTTEQYTSHLVTLHTILDTCSNFHTFRQEFEHANRNAAFFNHCNSRLCVASITPINAPITFP